MENRDRKQIKQNGRKRPTRKTALEEQKKSGGRRRFISGVLVCAAVVMTTTVLSGCSAFTRVQYQFAGGEETWQEAAVEEGLVSMVEEYYYNHLPEELHEAYREIYVHLMRNEDSGDFLTSISVKNFWDVYYAALADHPEIFWVNTSAQVTESGLTGNVISYRFDVTVPLENRTVVRQQLEAAADACISQIPAGASDYEKIKTVYEYIIRTTDYSLNSENSQNVQSALLNHSSVCAGYSKAFQYILHRMGMFCTYVTGSIRGGGDHGWNMVRISEGQETADALAGIQGSGQEEYYYVDVTWGDPVFVNSMGNADSGDTISYTYLCCTQEDLFQTHIPDTVVDLPQCTSERYDYYKLNGFYYETYDYGTLYQALMNSVQNGEDLIYMKFGSQQAYREAQTNLFEGDLLTDPGQYLMRANGVTSWNYRYHTDDHFWLITIYWN